MVRGLWYSVYRYEETRRGEDEGVGVIGVVRVHGRGELVEAYLMHPCCRAVEESYWAGGSVELFDSFSFCGSCGSCPVVGSEFVDRGIVCGYAFLGGCRGCTAVFLQER